MAKDLSGSWYSVARNSGAPNGDRCVPTLELGTTLALTSAAAAAAELLLLRSGVGSLRWSRYEFRREGERYYIVRPPGGAKKADDHFTFDGTMARHAHGPTARLLESGDLHWDLDGGKWLSRREGNTAGGVASQVMDRDAPAHRHAGPLSLKLHQAVSMQGLKPPAHLLMTSSALAAHALSTCRHQQL